MVKSLNRELIYKDGRKYQIPKKILHVRKNDDGYLICKLCKENTGKYYFVHRLVAEAFIDNPLDLKEVNHIDCNRANNAVENLEWCTHKYNVSYAIKNGNHVSCRNLFGINNPNYKNHRLHYVYKSNPQLAKEKLSRPKGKNGRAQKIKLTNKKTLQELFFDCQVDCAEYLKEHFQLPQKTKSIIDRIYKSVKFGKSFLGFNIEKV